MRHFGTFILLVSIFVANAIPYPPKVLDNDELIVTLSHGGKVEGSQKIINLRERYFSFKGIPYAEPPIGNLRLRNPRPHPGWEGVRNASSHGAVCVGLGWFSVIGEEDCLFLNVYTPPDLNPDEKYAVMFWIHGGSFTGGSGDSFTFGPELLVGQNVIVVTTNYRLGLLGFFSTNDKYAQGNYGLKDCVEALRWVQNNIEAFGGDPNRVTIFGESAGASLVHYLVLSPMAKGLFSGAISQSGTALNPWAFQDYPRTQAYKVAQLLNLTFTTTEDLVNQLRAVEDPLMFAEITPATVDLEVPRVSLPFMFAPSVEPEDSEEEIFLSEPPLRIMKKGTFNQVPYICGATNEEGLWVIVETEMFPDVLDKFNNNSKLLLPYEWYLDPESDAACDVINNIQNMYFKGEPVIKDPLDYVKYATDRHFEYAAYKTVELHASRSTQPVFFYIFSFDGALNYVKRYLKLGSYEGAMHADDLPYLFRMAGIPAPILPGNPALVVRSRMIKMWTDFAKFGTPTPETNELIPITWPRIQIGHEFMDIGENLVPGREPFRERMQMWKDLDSKYNNAP
uniref:Carboxylic ester hydrolase n=1 Tax=Culicoides sonorensis TaxID=179676 RepID=A0A336MI63_CULSO